MTGLLEGPIRRSDLARQDAEQILVPTARFKLGSTSVSLQIGDEGGVAFLLDTVLDPAARTETVSMYLMPYPHRHVPPPSNDWPSSNLIFDVDQEHGVAAVGLLTLERHEQGHQWISVGDAGRNDVTLEMDPADPGAHQFPPSSFITFAQLRRAVTEWAFGEILPPPSVLWREAADEVRWL
jgi:hypothetical protein